MQKTVRQQRYLSSVLFAKKIVCQQRYLTSVLFVNRHNRSLYCPITNTTWPSIFHVTYQSEFHTKPEKLQKYSRYYIYIHVTHVRLDIALMEGDLYPLWFLKNIIWMHLASKNRLYFLQKNCLSTKPTNICTAQWSINLNFIQNFKIAKKNAFMICLCYSHMFRCSYKN